MIVEIVLDWWPRLGTPGRRSRGSATHQRRRAPTSAAGPSCCVRGGLDTYAHGYGPDTRVSTSGSAPACGGGKLRRGARVGVELSAALANESTVRMLGTGRAVDDRVGVNPTVTTTLRSDPPLVPSTSSSVQCTPGSGPATADVSSGATRSPCRHGIGRSTRQVAGWSRTGRVLGGALPVFRAGALRTGVVDTLLATPREAGGLVDPPAVLCQRRLPWRPFTSCGGRGSLRVCFLATGCARTGRDAGTARGLATAPPDQAAPTRAATVRPAAPRAPTVLVAIRTLVLTRWTRTLMTSTYLLTAIGVLLSSSSRTASSKRSSFFPELCGLIVQLHSAGRVDPKTQGTASTG
jgi:hypothetical protein